MSKYIYKKLRHLFTKKLYFGFFQTIKVIQNSFLSETHICLKVSECVHDIVVSEDIH